MTSKQWMPLYIANYLADTAHLGAFESGGPRIRAVLAPFFGSPESGEPWVQKRTAIELREAGEIFRKGKGAALQMHSKCKASAVHLHTQSQSPSHGGGERATLDVTLAVSSSISQEAFKLSAVIARLCGHDEAFIPPAWAGAPLTVQGWLNKGWTAEQLEPACRRSWPAAGTIRQQRSPTSRRALRGLSRGSPNRCQPRHRSEATVNDVSLRISNVSPTAMQPLRVSDNAPEIEELVAEMMGGLKPPEISSDVFAAGACTMFATFPIETCGAVANPGTGYPSTEQFAPTLGALRLTLEAAARPHLQKREREARARALARERVAAQRDTGPRPSYEELQRRRAALGLSIGEPRRRKLVDAAAENARVRERYGISQEAWDEVPRRSAPKTRVNALTNE